MLKNMKIGLRLGLAFGIVLVMMAVLIVVGLSNMATIKDNIDYIIKTTNARKDTAKEMQRITLGISLNIRGMLLIKDIGTKGEFKKKVEDNRSKYSELLKRVEDMTRKDDTKGHELINQIKNNMKITEESQNRVMDLSLAGKEADALDVMLRESWPAAQKCAEVAEEFVKYQEEQLNKQYETLVSEYEETRKLMFTIGSITLLLAIGLAIFITRGIVKPINEGVSVMNSLAGGDLTVDVEAKSKDEIGQLMASISSMVKKLKEIVTDVLSASDNVASGSEELSASAQKLSQGAAEQAASVEETSSSMEEMASTVKQNADNAQQTEKIAKKSAEDARESGKAVNEAVAAMKQIAEKIYIIEEIER